MLFYTSRLHTSIDNIPQLILFDGVARILLLRHNTITQITLLNLLFPHDSRRFEQLELVACPSNPRIVSSYQLLRGGTVNIVGDVIEILRLDAWCTTNVPLA
jgi:hypothetical protein